VVGEAIGVNEGLATGFIDGYIVVGASVEVDNVGGDVGVETVVCDWGREFETLVVVNFGLVVVGTMFVIVGTVDGVVIVDDGVVVIVDIKVAIDSVVAVGTNVEMMIGVNRGKVVDIGSVGTIPVCSIGDVNGVVVVSGS
jgi:hypothetical protein